MSTDSVKDASHLLPSSQPSILSSTFSSIRDEGAASVAPCSLYSSTSTVPTSKPVHHSSVFDIELPVDTTTGEDGLFSLSSLKRRTKVLEEERLRYAQLGQRSAGVFEEHRRELTQLAQKERALRGHREDVLRTQLQETLQANHELMARVADQRRQYEKAGLVELEQQRNGNTHQDELGATLQKLQEEWAEAQRGMAETHASHEEHRRSLAACLRDQEHLRDRVCSLQDDLRSAEAAVAMERERGRVSEDWRGEMEPVSAPGSYTEVGWVEKPTSRTSAAASPGHIRQPLISKSDVMPSVRGGSSPKHHAFHRHFVPSGPWDVCGPCRASSPSSHHVEAMVATIERENYLRPRLYYRRTGREWTEMARVSASNKSPYRERRVGVVASRSPPSSASAACISSVSCAPATPPHHDHCHTHGNRQHSLGLSSSTLSDTTTSYQSTGTGSSSCCSCPTSAYTDPNATESRCTHSPFGQSCCDHRYDKPSPYRLRCRSLSVRVRGESIPAAKRTSAVTRMSSRRGVPNTSPHTFQVSPSAPPRAPAAAVENLHGAAVNAACRALITDLAQLRVDYRRCQRQLRDPHGDTVTASREMRRLMHAMDAKSAQVRAVRREQARHNDALRVQDVLREVIVENRYCEALYKDLLDLIRT